MWGDSYYAHKYSLHRIPWNERNVFIIRIPFKVPLELSEKSLIWEKALRRLLYTSSFLLIFLRNSAFPVIYNYERAERIYVYAYMLHLCVCCATAAGSVYFHKNTFWNAYNSFEIFFSDFILATETLTWVEEFKMEALGLLRLLAVNLRRSMKLSFPASTLFPSKFFSESIFQWRDSRPTPCPYWLSDRMNHPRSANMRFPWRSSCSLMKLKRMIYKVMLIQL